MKWTANDELPSGLFARRLLALICTRLVETQGVNVTLGVTAKDFYGALGTYPSGGVRGGIGSVSAQLSKLLGTSLEIERAGVTNAFDMFKANARRTKSRDLWGTVSVSEAFAKECRLNHIIVDSRTFLQFRSVLALDLYVRLRSDWPNSNHSKTVPVNSLFAELGLQPHASACARNTFRHQVLTAVRAVNAAQSEIQCYVDEKVFIAERRTGAPIPQHSKKRQLKQRPPRFDCAPSAPRSLDELLRHIQLCLGIAVAMDAASKAEKEAQEWAHDYNHARFERNSGA